jgi:hypothetical protein
MKTTLRQIWPSRNAVLINGTIQRRNWIVRRGGILIVMGTGEEIQWEKFLKKEPLDRTYSHADQLVQRIYSVVLESLSVSSGATPIFGQSSSGILGLPSNIHGYSLCKPIQRC